MTRIFFTTIKALSISFMLIMLPISSWAAENSSTYKVLIGMPSRDNLALTQAFQTAATQIITRLTGSTQAAANMNLKQAKNWIESYQIKPSIDNKDQPWTLDASFSPQAIKKALGKANLKEWETPRPTILFWIQDQQPSSSELPTNNPRWDKIQQLAKIRGLTLIKANEYAATDPNINNNNEGDQLAALANEYKVKDVVFVQIPNNTNLNEKIHWQWWHNEQLQQWDTQNDEKWADSALEKISSYLAKDAAAESSNINVIKINIDGIENFVDYAKVLAALHKITIIKDMVDDGLQDDKILVSLTTIASIADLKMALDKVANLSPEYIKSSNQADLSYYWGVKPINPDTNAERAADPATQPYQTRPQYSDTENKKTIINDEYKKIPQPKTYAIAADKTTHNIEKGFSSDNSNYQDEDYDQDYDQDY